MGGFVMPRKYRNIKDYEKEIIEYISKNIHCEKPDKDMDFHIKK